MVNISETRPSRRRPLLRAAAATVAAAGMVFTGATTATAQSLEMPSDNALFNGGLSLACQYAPADMLERCGQYEHFSSDSPAVLSVNPFTTYIVVLGAGLYEDGSIRPVLEQRLQAALRLANQYPTAPIIVTGGVPQNGVTEARAMNDWLVGAGVFPGRITQEDRSGSTVQNAQFSNRILEERGATAAVVVTNDFHLNRGVLNFRQAVGGRIPITGVVA
ncbi:YdcF family protein [Dietzia timorensis]|uniref:DUF218 domain-containing protein n=1 Tax=Dietzia timorensis TaxID=499555 RepID=A0A173LQA9_9ACTN|nr:YdcF family protein [Dietzia timorensis]ANI93898.1 Hypothetical protein BJL86_3139 [Dietzia timorensis]